MQDLISEPKTHSSIIHALAQVQDRIDQACASAGRDRAGVRLLAVSKTKPLSSVHQAYSHGQRHFGENYLQDALDKIEHCAFDDVCWHFIGAIQSNKTKTIAQSFDWVHTLDRLKIARRLNEQRPAHLPTLKVLIQVNISQESNKNGVALAQLDDLVAQVDILPNLELCGLMCIPAATNDISIQRHAFNQMTATRDRLNIHYPHLTQLSMGMSSDLDSAIACGATIVRIGTDIFGERSTSPEE